MNVIKFSHEYEKMPGDKIDTILLEVFITDNISERFKIYDTLIKGKNPFYSNSYYPLPKGKVIVLLLYSDSQLWTTIRRWTLEKEKYYRRLRGEQVKIEIL